MKVTRNTSHILDDPDPQKTVVLYLISHYHQKLWAEVHYDLVLVQAHSLQAMKRFQNQNRIWGVHLLWSDAFKRRRKTNIKSRHTLSLYSRRAEVHCDLVLVLSLLSQTSPCWPWHWPSLCTRHHSSYPTNVLNLKIILTLSYFFSWMNKLKQLSWRTLYWLRWNSLDFSHSLTQHSIISLTFLADFKGFRQELAIKASDPVWMVQERQLQEHNIWCKYIFNQSLHLSNNITHKKQQLIT